MALAFLLPFVAGVLAQSPYPAPGNLVDAGGYRVHLYCSGEGSPTVLIVGAGFSTDWSLVQPEVARFTRVCTYDPSGTAWSDPATDPCCTGRVSELSRMLGSAHVAAPLVLVGYSLGAIRARMYLEKYPGSVAGLVIVDHAIDLAGPKAPVAKMIIQGRTDLDSPPELISMTPIAAGLEDDPAFAKLPRQGQEIHRWAQPGASAILTGEVITKCFAEGERLLRAAPVTSIPLLVVSTALQSLAYTQLQAKLVALSSNGKQMIGSKSGHGIIVDEPGVVVEAIRTVVESVRQPARFD